MSTGFFELPGQRKLFGEDSAESDRIEDQLRQLKRAWGNASFDESPPIVEEIRRVTAALEVHPWFWNVPYCECRECREYDDYLRGEG